MIGFYLGVQFSRPVVSDSLRPHESQHARPPCPSPTPGVYSKSCPLSRWYHQTISSSVVPFCSRLWSFPASGSFPVSQFFESAGQSIEVSVSTSVLPMNIFGCTVVWILTHLLILVTNTTIRIQNNFITPKTSLVLYFLVKLTLSS